MMSEKFIEKLIEIGCLKFGNFTLKSGQKSPLYCDLRILISYPDLMTSIADALWRKYQAKIKGRETEYPKRICGVPYTALPIATHYSIKHGIPMVLRRKEAKSYGTKKLLEGIFDKGDECLIVEDVVTTGSSVLETAEILRSEGLNVTDAIVFVDRQQGAVDSLTKSGINVTTLINMTDIVNFVTESKKLPVEQIKILNEFVASNNAAASTNVHCSDTSSSIKERLDKISTKNDHYYLLQTMLKKRTNVCLSADLTSCQDVLNLIDSLGPEICSVKLHVDILHDIFDFGVDKFINEIQALGAKHQVALIEGRKFSDIGNTFKLQLFEGPFKISKWADFVTAHSVSGFGMLDALKKVTTDKRGISAPGIIFVSEMSTSNSLITSDYTKKTIELANENKDLVCGFVYRKKELFEGTDNFLRFMPGVSLEQATDGGDQNYVSVEQSITQELADVIIVGRAIIKSADPLSKCKEFKERGWKAFTTRYSDLQ